MQIHIHGSTFHAVVIQGRLEHREPDEIDVATKEPGSYFSSNERSVQVSCEAGGECIIYVHRSGRFNVIQVQAES
jgi:hypothetical protein